TTVGEVAQRVEVADIVALNLETGAVVGTGCEDVFDVGEGVLEHAGSGGLKIGFFPIELELLLARQHRVEAEIHSAHVEGGNLGFENGGGWSALLDCHAHAATGGDVDDTVRPLLDHLEKWGERLGRLVGPAVLGVARVQVHDGGARFGRADGRVRDLRGR